jgi:hypothetical protein
MDEFFQPGDGRWEQLAELRAAHRFSELSKLWHEMKEKQFLYYRNIAPIDCIIIWVGLTDHAASPDEPFYVMDVGSDVSSVALVLDAS